MLDSSGQPVVLNIAAEFDRLRAGATPERPCIRKKVLHRDDRRLFTLLALEADAEIPEHAAHGPVVIHIVAGKVEFTLHGRAVPLSIGQVLVLDSGVRHAVRAFADSGLLLEAALGTAQS